MCAVNDSGWIRERMMSECWRACVQVVVRDASVLPEGECGEGRGILAWEVGESILGGRMVQQQLQLSCVLLFLQQYLLMLTGYCDTLSCIFSVTKGYPCFCRLSE